jgi:hypothetical protein
MAAATMVATRRRGECNCRDGEYVVPQGTLNNHRRSDWKLMPSGEIDILTGLHAGPPQVSTVMLAE